MIALVKQKLGIAVIDSFTPRDIRTQAPNLKVPPIREEAGFQTHAARRRGVEPSGFGQHFNEVLLATLAEATTQP